MIIGICGKSGSGKSTVARELMELVNKESVHLDIDKIGHKVLAIPNVEKELIETFGSGIKTESGINRKKLGEIVFAFRSEMEKLTDIAKNAGGVAQDLAKNAGEAAQELAKAAQDKAAYLKELQGLKSAIREQEGLIAKAKIAIADKILEATDGQISQEVQELCAKVREAKSMITGLKNQIESLRASAAVKNPEVEKEINKAIAEIDRQNALDIAADVEEAAAEAEAKIEAEAEVKAE